MENNPKISLSDPEKKAVDEALRSVRQGRLHSHKEVMAIMKEKYPVLKLPPKGRGN